VYPPEVGRELRFEHRPKLAPATAQAVRHLAAAHAPAVFDDARRGAWGASMAAAGRVFAADGRPALAGLAAAAAEALDPASGVAIAQQPFVLAAMALSLFDHANAQAHGHAPGCIHADGHAHGHAPGCPHAEAAPGQAPASASPHQVAKATQASATARQAAKATQGFMPFADPLFAALPLGWPPADYRAALLVVAGIWNAGVAGEPMGPAMAVARPALERLLAQASAADRRTALAALADLPGRWALTFAGARLRVVDVRARRKGLELAIELVCEDVEG